MWPSRIMSGQPDRLIYFSAKMNHKSHTSFSDLSSVMQLNGWMIWRLQERHLGFTCDSGATSLFVFSPVPYWINQPY